MQEKYMAAIDVIENSRAAGVTFYDIDPLLGSPEFYDQAIQEMAEPLHGRVDKLAAFDSRGFLFAPAIARELGVGFTMLRKPGKLMDSVVGVDYDTEYSSDRLELQEKSVTPGQRVVLVDDLIATGGTALAGVELVQSRGAEVVEFLSFIDLPALGGSERLKEAGVVVRSLVTIGEVSA